MIENNNEFFSTTDLIQAAVLQTLGFSVVDVAYQIEGDKSRAQGIFSFIDSPELKKALLQNLSRKLAVEPNTFMTNLKALKSEATNRSRNSYNRD